MALQLLHHCCQAVLHSPQLLAQLCNLPLLLCQLLLLGLLHFCCTPYQQCQQLWGTIVLRDLLQDCMLDGLGQLLSHRAGAISGLKEQSSRVQTAVMRGGLLHYVYAHRCGSDSDSTC